jgi:hypothetical protein
MNQALYAHMNNKRKMKKKNKKKKINETEYKIKKKEKLKDESWVSGQHIGHLFETPFLQQMLSLSHLNH